ncbi:flippase-like domain-containing protein [Halobacteria archaeon AArc-m2/3/4]|uniref:Flippase-like domain-containing protein n=1 Tax=Natronoglomus mannanivorans TaxID=2979990 RepID=A0ABT2QIE2_9EURY|nr:flippase-like domain-containing protein [Halobacteria archaeon AArc-m2/3/4]
MRRRAGAGLAIALLVVGLLVYGVGWEAVLFNVGRANPLFLAAAFCAGAGMLVLRGYLVGRLLVPVSGSARGVPFVSAFLAGYFARSTLPWGRSTGTPIMAYLLARHSESEFEDNLAVVATAEVFGFIASVVVALVGLAMYTAAGETPQDMLLSLTLAGVGGLVAGGTLLALVGRGTARTVLFALTARWEAIAVKVPRVPGGDGSLESRVETFFDTLETVSAARRTLAVAFAIAVCSWLVNALPLYFSLLALGVDVPLSLALACAPLASFGGIIPLPGGTGGIEVVLTGLLVAMAAVSGDIATAATILYRLSTYWLHVFVGGIGALSLSLAGHRLTPG